MSVFRLLMILATLLSISLAGAVAAAHDPANAQPMHTAAHDGTDHPACCMESAGQMGHCQIFPAIIQMTEDMGFAPMSSASRSIARAILLDGTEPATSLDPPQPV